MNIFEMLSRIDLECFNISSSMGDMAPPTKWRLSKEKSISSIEGVVESSFVKVLIYVDTTSYVDKSVPMMSEEIYQAFPRKEVPKEEDDHEVYINIKNSWFHKIVTHLFILPCVNTIEWIIQQTDEKIWQ